jgi:hypothetical protein
MKFNAKAQREDEDTLSEPINQPTNEAYEISPKSIETSIEWPANMFESSK